MCVSPLGRGTLNGNAGLVPGPILAVGRTSIVDREIGTCDGSGSAVCCADPAPASGRSVAHCTGAPSAGLHSRPVSLGPSMPGWIRGPSVCQPHARTRQPFYHDGLYLANGCARATTRVRRQRSEEQNSLARLCAGCGSRPVEGTRPCMNIRSRSHRFGKVTCRHWQLYVRDMNACPTGLRRPSRTMLLAHQVTVLPPYDLYGWAAAKISVAQALCTAMTVRDGTF
jgi:hypothetical protein